MSPRAYITVDRDTNGYFAALVEYNPEINEYKTSEEGYTTYATALDAEEEAKEWADQMQLDYIPIYDKTFDELIKELTRGS